MMRSSKKVRNSRNLALSLTPKPSVFDAVSSKFTKAAKKNGITLDGLLKDLKKIRHKEP